MSVEYLAQRKHIIDQVLTGLDLSEKSHLISFEKIQRLLFEALQTEKSQELEILTGLQNLENSLLPQFQFLVENCKFGKKYLNIRQRLNIERVRNINYSDAEYIKDLDNLRQVGKKYKKEIEEICLQETLTLFRSILNKAEYRELLLVGVGSPDEYQLRKYFREKDQVEYTPELDKFIKEVENFLDEKFQDELILHSREATKASISIFFQSIQANEQLDVTRLSKDMVRSGIESIENHKFESFIQSVVNQIILLYLSYVKPITNTQDLQDDSILMTSLLAAMDTFLTQKKSIYETDHMQQAINKDIESLLPKSLEKSITALTTSSNLTPIQRIQNLKIFAREFIPTANQIMNISNKIFSETINNEVSLVYIEATDELSKRACKTSMKLINTGDVHASTYNFTLTPRLIEDEGMRYILFYGTREEKQNMFKSILASQMKEVNEDFSEENIVLINFLDQFQTLYLEVVFVNNNSQLEFFTSEKLAIAMKKEKFIKAEITPVFTFLQLDPTMFDSEFSQRLENSQEKKNS